MNSNPGYPSSLTTYFIRRFTMSLQCEQDIRVVFEILKTERNGIAALIKWLDEETDYFIAPASTKFHGAYEGGLAEHSWNVFDLLVKKDAQYMTCYPYDTLAICGLFHDLCKVNYYKINTEEPTAAQMDYLVKLYKGQLPVFPGPLNKDYVSKVINYKKNGGEKPEYTAGGYKVEDQLPLGHGEKSVILLQKFIDLSVDEMLAIRWHMVAFDAGTHFDYPSGFPFREATNKSPLLTLLFTADFEASNILERKT
jgi:hypothetical protein